MLRCVRRTAAEVLLLVMMMMVTSIEDVRERQMRSESLSSATELQMRTYLQSVSSFCSFSAVKTALRH